MDPSSLLHILLISTGIIIFIVLFRARQHYVERGMLFRSLSMVLLLVELPQFFKKEEWTKEREKEFVSIMEQLFSALTHVREKNLLRRIAFGHPHIAFEIAVHRVGEAIYFYAACPRNFVPIIEKHIVSFFPHAQVTLSQDYNIFNPSGASAGSNIFLMQPFMVPTSTFRQMSADPLANIVTALTTLAREGEGAAIQILIRPAPKKARKACLKVAELVRRGQKLNIAVASVMARQGIRGFFFWFFRLLGVLLSPPQPPSQPLPSQPYHPQQMQPPFAPGAPGPFATGPTPAIPLGAIPHGEAFLAQQELVKAIEMKATQNLFEVNIRLVASAPDLSRAQTILALLENAFAQFAHPALNSFRSARRQGKRLSDLFYRFSFRMFHPSEKIILGADELASIFHFPQPTLLVPKIQWLKAKQAPAPVTLPQEGYILGENVYRGERKLVRMLLDDRGRHLYIVGQTGTGKSVLIQELIRQDIEEGRGIALIDPHGDLAEHVLTLVPSSRIQDVIYLNPPDIERPIGLNMLEYDMRFPESKTFIVNELLEIFEKLYNLKALGFGGPIFEQYMRNAMLLVMEHPVSGNTLLEVPRVLSDTEFRHLKLSRCPNIVVKNFWEKEAEKAGGEAALANLVPYITSKMNMFISNDIMRPIIAQEHSAFSFRDIMDKQKILIVNLAKGYLGDTNSHLLGMIIVGRLFLSALSRVDTPEEQRKEFFLYMDEFQNITTRTVAGILAEARKYRLGLIMAHQYVAQLEEEIKNAVFGNVGTLLVFRVGAPDAQFLVKQFEPVFDENDLVNLDNYNAYIKLMINGQTSRPFNIKTFPPSTGKMEIAQQIKEFSRMKYGAYREEVEREVYERLSRLPNI